MFSLQLFVILLIFLCCFRKNCLEENLWKSCDVTIVWLGILCSAAGYILSSPRLTPSNFLKKLRVSDFFWSFGGKKLTTCLKLAKTLIIRTKTSQILLFHQLSLPLYDVMQIKSDNREFVQSVNFVPSGPFKNKCTKHLSTFDDYCEKICNWRAIFDNAFAGGHRRLSICHIKHNLFHQSKLGRDVQLQNTHSVLLKSHRDVRHVSTLNAELGLRWELNDWYRDSTSVPYGHLLIDLMPRTDDWLRYCINTGCISSKISNFERLKFLKSLDGENTNFL